jgi:hypothetical protein
MIINGKPITKNDMAQFSDLSMNEQTAVIDWIENNLIPRKTALHGRSSYGIKHLMQSAIGIYTTNNQFKGAMLQRGYEPVDPEKLNWTYHLNKKSPAFKL